MKYLLIFLVLIASASAIPVPVSIQGTAYDLEGNQLVKPQVSLTNLDNGYYVEGIAGRGENPGRYVFSVRGDIGNELLLTVTKNGVSESLQFELLGVMRNVDLYLNTTQEIVPQIVSNPIDSVFEDENYTYEVIVNNSLNPEYYVIGPFGMYFENNILKWKPKQENTGTNNVLIQVLDGDFILNQSFSIEVVPVNDKPIILSGPITSAFEDENYTYEVIVYDEENNSINYSVIGPIGMYFENNILKWKPKQENTGTNNVTIIVSDGVNIVQQNFIIIVEEVNDRPIIISNPNTTAYEGNQYSYEFFAFDPDNETLVFSLIIGPSESTIIQNTLYWTPKNYDIGENLFVIQVSDGLLSSNQSFIVNVIDVNNKPKIISTPENVVFIGETYYYEIIAQDDSDSLAYSAFGPENFILENNKLSWKPKGKHFGDNTFEVVVSDGELSDTQTFVVNVDKRNSGSMNLNNEFENEKKLSSSNDFEVFGIKSPFEISGFVDSRNPVEIKIRNLQTGEVFETVSNPSFRNFYSQLVYGKAGDELEIEVGDNLITGYVLKDQQVNIDLFNQYRPLYLLVPIIILCIGFIVWRKLK